MIRRSYLSAAVLALVAAGASAPAIMDQMVREKEGFSLAAYRDGAKIWTDCHGRAHHNGKPGRTPTVAECEAWLKSEIGRRLGFINGLVQMPLPQTTLAALGSWCFNVGNAGCARSTTVRLLNEGDINGGCRAMLKWRFITRDGRKIDCSTEQPYCKGVWLRRLAEAELCAL